MEDSNEKNKLKSFMEEYNKAIIIYKTSLTYFSPNLTKKLNYILNILNDNSENNDILLKEHSFEYLAYLFTKQIILKIPKINIKLSKMEKNGKLNLRSQTLKIWKEHYIKLNYEIRILFIYKNIDQDSQKIINLNSYAIRWIGDKSNEKNYIFSLESLSSLNRYKNLLFGFSIEKISREWYQNIKDLINDIEFSELIIGKIDNSLKNKEIMSMSLGKFEKNKEKETKLKCSKSISTYEVIEKQENESINRKNHIYKQKSESFKENDFHLQVIDTKSDELINLDEKIEINKNNLESNSPYFFNEILNAINYDFISNKEGMTLLESKNNTFIFQNLMNYTQFKVFSSINTINLDKVLSFFTQCSLKLNWIKEITELKILKMIEFDSNTSIIYEKRKKYGIFYNNREFIYMRTIKKQDNEIYLIDKSINYDEKSSNYLNLSIRGLIKSSILLLKREKNEVKIILSIDISNLGFLLKNQDTQITLLFLRSFYNLQEEFFKIYENDTPLKIKSIKEILIKDNEIPELEKNLIKTKENNEISLNEISPNEIILNEISPSIKSEFSPIRKNRFEKDELNLINSMTTENRTSSYDINLKFQSESEIIDGEISNDEHNYLLELLKKIENGAIIIESITNKYNFQYIEPKTAKILKISKEKGHYSLKNDWKEHQNGGLIFINQNVLKVQKNILSYLIKRLGSNIIQGKSISSISMPIEMNITSTELEKNAFNFGFLPYFMNKAENTLDTIEQMKLTISFCITMFHMGASQKKPFSSQLGETFQASLGGYKLYFEQIKKDPIIPFYLIIGKNCKIYGYYDINANLNANSCFIKNKGIYNFYFNNAKNLIQVYLPSILISGTAFGQRTFNYEEKMFFIDKKNNLFCELIFNPDKKGFFSGMFAKKGRKSDCFIGEIYSVNKNFWDKFNRDFEGINEKELEIYKIISKIEGIWHKYIKIDDKIYWKFGDFHAFEVEYEKSPLPSDSTFREDVIWWKIGNKEKAQTIMENKEIEEKKEINLRKTKYKIKKNKK